VRLIVLTARENRRSNESKYRESGGRTCFHITVEAAAQAGLQKKSVFVYICSLEPWPTSSELDSEVEGLVTPIQGAMSARHEAEDWYGYAHLAKHFSPADCIEHHKRKFKLSRLEFSYVQELLSIGKSKLILDLPHDGLLLRLGVCKVTRRR
jgi:hypothetical protein